MASNSINDSIAGLATTLGVEPDMLVVFGVKVEIDTTPTGVSRTWATLSAGIDNLAEALNEQVQQYFFLSGQGYANNFVTGAAPAYTLTGRRILGDAAQDYIFGAAQKFGLMKNRQTHMRLTRRSATTGTDDVISANITLCNLTDLGGATNDGSAISMELRFDGQPVAGDVWAAA